MNILIAANTNYMDPTSIMVDSLCQNHGDKEVNIYLAYHDLCGQDIERLRKIAPCLEKKKYVRLM